MESESTCDSDSIVGATKDSEVPSQCAKLSVDGSRKGISGVFCKVISGVKLGGSKGISGELSVDGCSKRVPSSPMTYCPSNSCPVCAKIPPTTFGSVSTGTGGGSLSTGGGSLSTGGGLLVSFFFLFLFFLPWPGPLVHIFSFK